MADTAPTSTVATFGSGTEANASGTYIGYFFDESKFAGFIIQLSSTTSPISSQPSPPSSSNTGGQLNMGTQVVETSSSTPAQPSSAPPSPTPTPTPTPSPTPPPPSPPSSGGGY